MFLVRNEPQPPFATSTSESPLAINLATANTVYYNAIGCVQLQSGKYSLASQAYINAFDAEKRSRVESKKRASHVVLLDSPLLTTISTRRSIGLGVDG